MKIEQRKESNGCMAHFEALGFGRAGKWIKVFLLLFLQKKKSLPFLVVLSCLLTAAAPIPDHAKRADGARVIPDRFLRDWDPITIFYPADIGPGKGGPEDTPTRFATLQPAKPGAWTWLGPRVLQFRPAEAWEPLRREIVTIAGHATELVPLLPVPVAAGPADDDTSGIPDLDRIALTFQNPVDRTALARLLTIEIRPQPGIGTEHVITLTAQDFGITAVERSSRSAPQTYVVVLHRPIPDGQVATLRLRLSDAPGLDAPIYEKSLHSLVPFAFLNLTCASGFRNSSGGDVITCAPGGYDNGAVQTDPPRSVELSFTAPPEALDVVHARDVLRISPHVDALTAVSDGTTLRLAGKFQTATVYTLAIAPGTLHDTRGRALAGVPDHQFAFAAAEPVLRWDASQGIVERFGPQMVPMRGQGYAQADLRIHPVDPLSRDFWPFPQTGLLTRDDAAPPLPGREPLAWDQPGPISPDDMALRLAALGSPSVSTLVDLPLRPGGLDQKFGLDMAPHLARIAGAGQPGAYLMGMRPLDARDRHWIRVQVTDLSLTTVEEAGSVRFVVTSLATAAPVPGATIELQQVRRAVFDTIAHGVTSGDGSFTWTVPESVRAHGSDDWAAWLSRIVVTKGNDTLVMDPRHGPPQYTEGGWGHGSSNWLGWAARGAVAGRTEKPRLLCHVFTERPIYRPDEKVLIAGMVRNYAKGSLSFARGSAGRVVITGPDSQEWKLPAPLDDFGGFHITFPDKTTATGEYALYFQPGDGQTSCGATSFKKEAYRLPTFEVLLTGAQKVALDRPFNVDLLARWFAGGLVADRPIAWRVTQFPYVWSPPGRDGFAFSSDSRFSGDVSFRSTPVLTRDVKTDAGGSAQLVLDPTIEPTAQPREYVVEATVTGDDDMQVRSVQHVVALPPFVLGVKLPRYIPHAAAIDPEVLALDGDGNPQAGLKMTVRLIRRNWNSVLQASDFAAGSAKYDTQVIDETVAERQVVSGADATPLHFDTPQAGVYIVELTAADKIGRTQTVRIDSFVAGDTPVTWAQPPAQTMTMTPDKKEYAPGETATLVIQSPFQTARGLVVIEQPEGPFDYSWVDVRHGYGRISVPIRKPQMPKLAVHVLLMRGRLPGPPLDTAAPFDQGKPTTIAATSWITITPVENEVRVTFEAPAMARPEQEVDLVLHLADAAGRPLAGEATVWMVDQAVLSLAREQRLDPLPDFIVQRPSRMVARDTRNLVFGIIPLSEAPGGGAGGDQGVENISVRKNFTPVPLYVPRVHVGPDGTARVHVKLPDTLTVYMLRAKAISGPDRFGAGTGSMRIRLPLVAQPVLPRFLRPGDSFGAAVIGRLVEGKGGAGIAFAHATGATLQAPKPQDFTWNAGHPARVSFPVTVPEDAHGQVGLRFTMKRVADGAGDAVELDLPVQPDRPVLHLRDVQALSSSLVIPALGDAPRPGTYRRTVTLAADPLLVRIVAGLSYLLEYPFGCTEQRLALAGSELALKPYAPILNAARVQDRVAADVASTLAEITANTDANGLVAYWPHTNGSVLLTAWAFGFVVQAEQAGLPVDKAMRGRLVQVLKQALRSDYPHLFDDAALLERVAALLALASGGDLEPAYATELARRAPQLPTESLAQIIIAITLLPPDNHALLPNLETQMWDRVQTRLQNGAEVYAGLAAQPTEPLILPSEARGLAEVTRAAAIATPQDSRRGLLRDGLLRIADGDGWGSTNATAAALRALSEAWSKPAAPIALSVTLPESAPATLSLNGSTPLVQAATARPGEIRLGAIAGGAPLAVLNDTDYVPATPGYAARAASHGFVISREWFRVPATGPQERLAAAADGPLHLNVGDVVEEVDSIVNPAARTNVAWRLPLAAGMEPLNPNLATSPASAAPSAPQTQAPDYAAYGDDAVLVVYQTLPAGTYTFRTRMRALVDGLFTAPPADAEAMYTRGVNGSSDGARFLIARAKE